MAYTALEKVAEESHIKRGEHKHIHGQQRVGSKTMEESNLDWMSTLALTLGLVLVIHYLNRSVQQHYELGSCHLHFTG